jgi:hypothetical protein
MSEQDIRRFAGVVASRVENVTQEEDPEMISVVTAALALATQALVDLHRIADAVEALGEEFRIKGTG